MQSALAAIPAMIEVTFPDGFTPAEATRVEATFTRSAINCESPACSASAITGTRPASDTKCSSSNSGVALDHACDSFTASAFWFQIDQDVNTPDSSVPEGTSTSASPRGHRSAADRPRIEAKPRSVERPGDRHGCGPCCAVGVLGCDVSRLDLLVCPAFPTVGLRSCLRGDE